MQTILIPRKSFNGINLHLLKTICSDRSGLRTCPKYVPGHILNFNRGFSDDEKFHRFSHIYGWIGTFLVHFLPASLNSSKQLDSKIRHYCPHFTSDQPAAQRVLLKQGHTSNKCLSPFSNSGPSASELCPDDYRILTPNRSLFWPTVLILDEYVYVIIIQLMAGCNWFHSYFGLFL